MPQISIPAGTLAGSSIPKNAPAAGRIRGRARVPAHNDQDIKQKEPDHEVI